MADTPEMLTARVNALTQRVATLEKLHVVPPVTQPPAVTDSQDLTTVSPGGTIVFGGKPYTIIGGQAAIGGTVVANTNGVVLLKLVLHPQTGTAPGVYQKNSANNWYGPVTPATGGNGVSGDPSVAPPVVVPPVVTVPPTVAGVPIGASSAGYNTLVFNSDFDNPSEIADYHSPGNHLWWTGSPDGAYGFGTGNMSIANSILSINQSTGSASSLSTGRTNNIPVVTPGSRPANMGDGVAFRYGYFEAKMRFNSAGSGGTGWPAFWMTQFDLMNNGDHLEIDFMENQGSNNFNGGFLNWFGGQGGSTSTPGQSRGQYFGALGADGYPGSSGRPSWDQLVRQAGLDLNGGWNIFGCLWSPTRLSFWWNSFARRQQGIADLKIAEYPTSVPIHGFVSNDFGRPFYGTLLGATNGNPGFMIIAGNLGKSVQFDWVHVYR